VDRDQREAARRDRVTEPLGHAHGDPRRPPCLLRQHKIARLGTTGVGDLEVATLALLDALQPQPPAFLVQHAEHQFLAARELLHRVRDPAIAGFLGAREDSVADAKATRLALAHAQPRRRCIGLPALGRRPDRAAVVGIDDAQHRDLGQAAKLVEGAPRSAVDQPLIGHVLEQRLERDLLLRGQPEGARDFALSRRDIGGDDEIENLLPGRQAGRGAFGHRPAIRAARANVIPANGKGAQRHRATPLPSYRVEDQNLPRIVTP
jgi:hypothetical protein